MTDASPRPVEDQVYGPAYDAMCDLYDNKSYNRLYVGYLMLYFGFREAAVQMGLPWDTEAFINVLIWPVRRKNNPRKYARMEAQVAKVLTANTRHARMALNLDLLFRWSRRVGKYLRTRGGPLVILQCSTIGDVLPIFLWRPGDDRQVASTHIKGAATIRHHATNRGRWWAAVRQEFEFYDAAHKAGHCPECGWSPFTEPKVVSRPALKLVDGSVGWSQTGEPGMIRMMMRDWNATLEDICRVLRISEARAERLIAATDRTVRKPDKIPHKVAARALSTLLPNGVTCINGGYGWKVIDARESM